MLNKLSFGNRFNVYDHSFAKLVEHLEHTDESITEMADPGDPLTFATISLLKDGFKLPLELIGNNIQRLATEPNFTNFRDGATRSTMQTLITSLTKEELIGVYSSNLMTKFKDLKLTKNSVNGQDLVDTYYFTSTTVAVQQEGVVYVDIAAAGVAVVVVVIAGDELQAGDAVASFISPRLLRHALLAAILDACSEGCVAA